MGPKRAQNLARQTAWGLKVLWLDAPPSRPTGAADLPRRLRWAALPPNWLEAVWPVETEMMPPSFAIKGRLKIFELTSESFFLFLKLNELPCLALQGLRSPAVFLHLSGFSVPFSPSWWCFCWWSPISIPGFCWEQLLKSETHPDLLIKMNQNQPHPQCSLQNKLFHVLQCG